MKPSIKISTTILLACILLVTSTVGCEKTTENGVGKEEAVSTEERGDAAETVGTEGTNETAAVGSQEEGTSDDTGGTGGTDVVASGDTVSMDNSSADSESGFSEGSKLEGHANDPDSASVESVSAETEGSAAGDAEKNDAEDSYTDGSYAGGYAEEEGLSDTQRNSINMLNYLTVLTQQINESKGNQLFLESAYSALVNDIYPNAVDTNTQVQIISLMDTVDSYRMIAVKRNRLEYIFDQNRAQAMRQAIPNPVGLLSAVQSGNMLKAAASVIYMAVDSVSSYKSATSQADLQFIKDGWELDDTESAELNNSTKKALTYMLNMVRDYDLPGDYALNEESVTAFVEWAGKPDSQIVQKIAWFESHEDTYQKFGPYWLEIAKGYFNSDRYEECFNAIRQFEAISTRIFRKDVDYAKALPMAIVSAKEIMDQSEYVKTADDYCSIILANIKDSDWSLRYYTAQVYLDLYALTKDDSYLDKAYGAVFDNVVILVEEQKELNEAYLADVKEEKAESDATKRQKKEIKEYNNILKEERKIALPPVSGALFINCDLLFALADEMDISESKKNQIDAILHENGSNIFLAQALDDRFWFVKDIKDFDADEINIEFDGSKLTVPASCVTDRSVIDVTVKGENGDTTLEDWTVTKVKREKGADCSEFTAHFESKTGKNYNYRAGETVSIKVIPVAESEDEYIEFTYNVVEKKTAVVFKSVDFERVTK